MPNEGFEAKVKHEDTRHVDWASGIAGMKHVKKCRPICVQFLVTINVHESDKSSYHLVYVEKSLLDGECTFDKIRPNSLIT